MLRHDYAIAFIQIEHRVFGCKVSKLKHYVKVGLFRTDTLEEHGTAVWRLIDGRRTVQEIITLLAGHFQGEDNYSSRVAAYIMQLHKDGLIKYELVISD